MPRQPWLDAPRSLHQVIGGGLKELRSFGTEEMGKIPKESVGVACLPLICDMLFCSRTQRNPDRQVNL